jgi:hypothetical protein
MEGKARFVFPVVITAIIVFVVSGSVTFFSIGWRNDFVIRWCPPSPSAGRSRPAPLISRCPSSAASPSASSPPSKGPSDVVCASNSAPSCPLGRSLKDPPASSVVMAGGGDDMLRLIIGNPLIKTRAFPGVPKLHTHSRAQREQGVNHFGNFSGLCAPISGHCVLSVLLAEARLQNVRAKNTRIIGLCWRARRDSNS